jgi:hypothetical protein
MSASDLATAFIGRDDHVPSISPYYLDGKLDSLQADCTQYALREDRRILYDTGTREWATEPRNSRYPGSPDVL